MSVQTMQIEYMAEADQAKADLQTVAAEIHDLRMQEADLKRRKEAEEKAFKRLIADKQEALKLEEIGFELMFLNEPFQDFTDPRTNKINKDYTAMLVVQAKANSAVLKPLREEIRRLEVNLEETQADLSCALDETQAKLAFALDRFSAIRHSARLVTAQLTYLASA